MGILFKRGESPSIAAGYPASLKVVATRLRVGGDWLRRRGPVVLRNGNNTFRVDADRYAHIAVEPGEQGVYSIVGRPEVGGTATVLASFGSKQAAINGNEALMSAYARLALTSWGAGWKWAGAAVGLYVLATVIGASAGAASSQVAMVQPMPANVSPVAHSAASQGAFNPNEPTLEQLASGEYRFEPKLQAPEIVAPALECAQAGAKK